MPIPIRQNMRIGSHLLRQKLKGDKHYPFIVEIEPLFACNLSCPGCGKIQHPDRHPAQAAVGGGRRRGRRGERHAHGLDRRG